MSQTLTAIGWREWLSLPELGIAHVKAKVDTGARTSTLHAFLVEPYQDGGAPRVRFQVHPLQKRTDIITECHADVIDRRWVSDSGGHREQRFIILTTATLGATSWPIELTLTDRETMLFRMLLGRTALLKRFTVDPAQSYLQGKPPHPD